MEFEQKKKKYIPFEKENGIFQTSSVGFDSMFFVVGSIHAAAGIIQAISEALRSHRGSLQFL